MRKFFLCVLSVSAVSLLTTDAVCAWVRNAAPGETMSCYHLSRFLFDVKMNDAFSAKASLDLEGAMRDYDLTAEEREALKSGDPRKLRQLGVHGMLCLYVKRLSPEFRNNIYWTQK